MNFGGNDQACGGPQMLRFGLAICVMIALTGCAPDVSKNTGSNKTRETTSGTAEQGSETSGTSSMFPGMKPLEGAVLAWPKPSKFDENATGALELHADPVPDGVRLPYPGAFIMKDIEPGKRGGTFTYCSFGEPKTFNPLTANEQTSNDILGRLYEGLVGFDSVTQTYYPNLISDMVMENGNAAIWLLKLREGLKWSDGHPLTANDIMFSAKVIYDPKIVNPAKDILQVDGKPLEIEKVDELTVRVKCARPTGLLHVIIGSLQVLPEHSLKAAYEAGTFESALNINTPPNQIVVNGPFKLQRYVTGERTVLERNPQYFKFDTKGTQLPFLDTMTFSTVPDHDAVMLRFMSGECDAISYPRPQSLFDLRDQQKTKNYSLYDCGPRDSVEYLWLNQKKGINPTSNKPYIDPAKQELFANIEFRKAIYHALNKDAIIASVMRGQAVNMWGPETPALMYWHNPDVTKYPYDPVKSKQLLDAADMKDRNGDGIREMANGTLLSFTIISNKGNKTREEIATLLSQDLKAVGIEGKTQYVDFSALVTKLNDSFEYEACYLGFGGSVHPIGAMNTWRSNGRTHFFNPLQENPGTPWEAEIDKLCNEFSLALSPTEQRKIFFKMQEIVSDNVPYFPTFTGKAFHAIKNRFGNVKPVALGEIFWNVEELFVK
jgi:peptide/nickel transport system substrate-binding protein